MVNSTSEVWVIRVDYSLSFSEIMQLMRQVLVGLPRSNLTKLYTLNFLLYVTYVYVT